MSMRHCLRWHYMCRPILKIYQLCALLILLVICCLIEILLAVLECMGAAVNGNNQWEWEGNGNKTRLNLGSGMGMGINYWEWDWKRYSHSSLIRSDHDLFGNVHHSHCEYLCPALLKSVQGFRESQVAGNRYLPLTGCIALLTVYALGLTWSLY